MRAGGRVQRDVRQPRDLGQRVLKAPHQLQRALRAGGVLERVELGVAGERGDPFVELWVVLHRAGTERIEAGVEVEVALRQAVVVPHDLGLARPRAGGVARRGAAPVRAVRRAGAPGRRARARRTPGDRGVSARRSSARRRPRRSCAHSLVGGGSDHAPTRSWAAATSARSRPAATASPTSLTSRSMSARVRRSVIATSSPFSYSG